MYIHEEIQKAVLQLIKKYDLDLIDLLGEINHAAFELVNYSERGIQELIIKLENKS